MEHHHSIIKMHSSVQHHHIIIMCSCSTIRDLSIIHRVDIIRATEEALEEETMEEEPLEEVKDQ